MHNTRTYPSLLRLFGELGVATQDSEMSMSVRCEGCGLEYAGARRIGGLFPQPSNLARPRYLRMLGEVLRFHRHARRVLADERAGDIPLGAFLAVGGYSRYFTEHFMLPVVSAVWSAGETVSLSYPARYLFTFLDHHGMLAVGGSPSWRTVVGGSRSYVQRVVKGLTAVHVGTPVRAVTRTGGGRARSGTTPTSRTGSPARSWPPTRTRRWPCWPGPPTPSARCSGAFRYSRNETWLHHDTSVLPRRRRRAGVVELPQAGLLVGRRPGAGQLRHEPAAAAGRAGRLRGHAERGGPGRPGPGAGPDDATSTRSTPRSRWPRSAGCPS